MTKKQPDDWMTASGENGMDEYRYPKQMSNREDDCKKTDRALVAALEDRRTPSSTVAWVVRTLERLVA